MIQTDAQERERTVTAETRGQSLQTGCVQSSLIGLGPKAAGSAETFCVRPTQV